MQHRLTACLLMVFAAGALAGTGTTQSADQSLVTDDVRFAENLAKYGYYELAADVLAGIKTRKLESDEEGTVDFTEARILKRASENTADDALRLQLQTQAIELLHDWGQSGTIYAYHDRRADALSDLASLYQARGKLRERMSRDDPARAETLRELADKDFEQADKTLNDQQNDFEKRAEQAAGMENSDLERQLRNEAAVTFYKLGLNSLDWANVAKDPEYRLEKAFDFLVDYQWALTDEGLGQYSALHYQGVARHRMALLASDDDERAELFDEALEIQAEVLNQARWYWDNYLGPDMDPGVALLVAEVFDTTWGAQAAVYADMGDMAAANAAIDTMLSEHEKAEQPFPRAGFDVLLDWAEVLRGVGDDARSGELIKLVADRASNLPQGERARRLLADIFTGGAVGTNSSPSVLLAAAKGLYDKGDFGEAAYVYESAAAAATTPADRQAVTVDAWLGAGRSFSQEKRHLEAGLSYEYALEEAIALGQDEDSKQSAAGGMYNAYSARFNETKDDFDKGLRDKASRRLAELGIEGDIPFIRALERFSEAVAAQPQDPALYRAAREEFEAVGPSAPSYERALVAIARCLAGEGRIDEALAAFDAMFARADDPDLKPANSSAEGKRDAALAEAYNYKADLLLHPDVNRAEEALGLLEGFEEKLPGQPGFIESVKSLRTRAFCRLERFDEAEAELASLLEYKAGSAYGRIAAFEVAQSMAQASEVAREAGDIDRWRDLLSRAADAMWTYNELAGFVSFANLLSNGEWFSQVDRPDEATRAYKEAVDRFDEPDSGVTPAQLDEARLGLAAGLTSQHEFGKARLRPQRIWWESKLGAIYAYYRLGASQPQALLDARKVIDSLKLVSPGYDTETIDSLPPEQRYEPLFKPLFEYLDKKVPK
jgi:hypothetical protein